MKNFIKKITFFIIGNNFISFLLYQFIKYRNSKIYVINYHKTSIKNLHTFNNQIKFYKKNFELISENDLLKYINGEKLSGKKPKLLISFDDGHISNYDVTSKILNENNIKGLFFIPAKYIDRIEENSLESECEVSTNKYNIPCFLNEEKNHNRKRVSMNWNNINELINYGHSIGCHGYLHKRLSKNLTHEELEEEINKGRKIIETNIKKPIKSFAWIGGETWSYSNQAAKLISDAKFNLSFMTCAKPFDKAQNQLQLHRFNIEDFFDLNQVRTVLFGFYELIYFLKRLKVNKITKI